MGRSLCKAVVPFKIENILIGQVSDWEDLPKVPLRDFYEAMEDDITPGAKTVKGWSFQNHEAHTYTQGRESLYVTKLNKGPLAVYEINEDEYSNGGGLLQSFFSDDKPSLEEFCKDWGFDPALIIQNVATVQML